MEKPEAQNVAEVIIAKQRNGPVGTVKLHFDGGLTRFHDLAVNRRYANETEVAF